MNPITFQIVPGSDKEYYAAFEAMGAEGEYVYDKATFGNISDKARAELAQDSGFQDVLNQGMRVFPNFSFHFTNRFSVNITRHSDEKSLFDKVSISIQGQPSQNLTQFAKFAAVVQRHLGQTSLLNIGNLLGPAATQHFEAREIALARLEQLAANLLGEMEKSRQKREQETEEKRKALEEQFQRRHIELEAQTKKRLEELEHRTSALDARGKELDDRAAKHARRQHYKEIKEKFNSWSEKFHVTEGTSGLRKNVYWFTILLTLLFGGLAAWFLFQSITAQDSAHLISAIVKQITFTLLFVSTAFFFIRWNNQWFQRHADEEFRLKRMELDIDRASWFVEMAFEWKEEKGEEIPLEIIERLTQGLFTEDSHGHSVEPADSLAQALLGASRFKVKTPDGTEVEYDRKGIQRLLKQKTAKKEE